MAFMGSYIIKYFFVPDSPYPYRVFSVGVYYILLKSHRSPAVPVHHQW